MTEVTRSRLVCSTMASQRLSATALPSRPSSSGRRRPLSATVAVQTGTSGAKQREGNALTWQEWSDMQDAFEAKWRASHRGEASILKTRGARHVFKAHEFSVPYTSQEARAAFAAFSRKYVLIKAQDALNSMYEVKQCGAGMFGSPNINRTACFGLSVTMVAGAVCSSQRTWWLRCDDT